MSTQRTSSMHWRTPGMRILVIGALLLGAFAAPASAAAATDLGGLDLEKYCTDHGFDYLVMTKPQLGHNAGIDNFHCARAVEDLAQISLEQACQAQYGTAVRFAFVDRDDAFSGRCYDAASGAEVGDLDLETYCANQGDYLVLTKPQLAQNAGIDNFHCAHAAEELAQISFERACQAQYGRPVRFAFLDSNDAFSGRCFSTGD